MDNSLGTSLSSNWCSINEGSHKVKWVKGFDLLVASGKKSHWYKGDDTVILVRLLDRRRSSSCQISSLVRIGLKQKEASVAVKLSAYQIEISFREKSVGAVSGWYRKEHTVGEI
ncbi:hypothetical protein Tco_1524608 [Tanacetum coccineum]